MADRRGRLAALLLVVLAISSLGVLGACGKDDEPATSGIALDGSPRVPDAEGVVVDIADDFSTLTLDGDRTFEIPKDVQSFSTVDGSTQPLRRRLDQYVHLGLDGKTVRWIAGIAAVAKAGDGPGQVFYTGELRDVRGERLDFADGTVLRLADAADATALATAEGTQVLVTIDPTKRAVVAVAAQ